jgi:hypothetical protein
MYCATANGVSSTPMEDRRPGIDLIDFEPKERP